DLPVKQSHSEYPDNAKKLNASVYLMALFIFLFGSFFFVFQTNIALLVVSKGYGDATLSGMINTALAASGMVTGICYGKIKERLKIRTIPFGIAAVGLGMGLIYLVGSLPSLFVSAILVGFGISLVMPTGFYIAANVVENRLQPTAIALLTAAVNLGMFVSPLLFNMINFQTVESTLLMKFIIASIALFILAIAFVFGNRYILKMQRQQKSPL
ncbi:MAG: MFS transporter, partial [Acetobacterium sp.]|nr:MFS transporter [Acetobacterium sp.]